MSVLLKYWCVRIVIEKETNKQTIMFVSDYRTLSPLGMSYGSIPMLIDYRLLGTVAMRWTSTIM